MLVFDTCDTTNSLSEYVSKYASREAAEDAGEDSDDDDEMSSVGSFDSDDEPAGNMDEI